MRLRKAAQRAVKSERFSLARWWSNKYKRPPNDPLFLGKSEAFWLQEMFEDIYERKAELEAQLEDETLRLEERRVLSQKLRAILRSLGEKDVTKGEDSLIDKWEAELEAGITPDLDEA
jgi:hypothetical protein